MPACNPNRVNTVAKISVVVCVHVMSRRIAIGQPNARVISRITVACARFSDSIVQTY